MSQQQQQPQQPRAPPAASAASNPGLIGFLRHQVTHRPSLIPLFLIMGTAVAGAGLYLMRLALLCPEVRWQWRMEQERRLIPWTELLAVTVTVTWDKKNNPEPWNNLDPTHRYKFFAVNMDYSKLQKDRPDF